MLASVIFFEEIPFFSSFTQDVNFVQKISLMPLVDPFVYPTHNTIPTSPRISQLKEHLCNHFQTKDLGLEVLNSF